VAKRYSVLKFLVVLSGTLLCSEQGNQSPEGRFLGQMRPLARLRGSLLTWESQPSLALRNFTEAHFAGAGFRPLKDTWADTTTPRGQLMLTIPCGLAEFERTLIRARTGEGRERAKARGVRFGRPKKLTAHQRREALARLNAGDAVAEIARTFGIDRATVYRLKY
jgi:Resolvase, N terminal domain/Helix-turn-helix domain of resolvase